MDERANCLVVASLKNLIPMTEQADAMFNARLLETYPDVYRVFATDFGPQERSFTRTIRLILGHLRCFGEIASTVKVLAQSDRICRLVDLHYQALAETLMWTLRRSLGATFTIDVERAWVGALWGSFPRKASVAENR